jgi:hypothetical protein
VRFSFDPALPPNARVDPASITVNGAPLEAAKEYAVATKAYLALGKDGYDVFKEVGALRCADCGGGGGGGCSAPLPRPPPPPMALLLWHGQCHVS